MRNLIIAFVGACALTPLPLLAGESAAPSDVGRVAFANSGAPEAQADFLRALALLHNFEYPDAADAFRKAQEIDPSFAMAYWGEAMTFTHPIWFEQDADAARAALERLAATPAERSAKAKTERERAYLATVEVLYGEGSKEGRDVRYSEAMGALHARYPEDVDATAFYALSLLGTAHEGRDFATYMRAAALLEEVFPANQHHPGVLHYLIHSYDDPIHAPLGMRAARLYGGVAPNAPHALHMTSHIFIAMGMWDDVVDANRRALEVANRQRAALGKPPAWCGHIPTWLHYGYLQERRNDEARKMLDDCRAFASSVDPAKPAAVRHTIVASYVEMLANHVASGTSDGSTEALAIPEGEDYADERFTMAYTDVLAAARSGDSAGRKSASERLRALHAEARAAATKEGGAGPAYGTRADVMLEEAEALELLSSGKRDDGLALLEKAAAAEQSMTFEFGPPLVPKPATELLAEQLRAAGRAGDAAAAYRKALERTPGRTATLEGLLSAEKAAGQTDSATRTEAQITRQRTHCQTP